MAVPKYDELFGSFLKAVGDGNIHPLKEIRNIVAEDIHLSEEDRAELLPSGKQTVYNGPIGLDRYSENYREHGRIAVEERSICHGTKDELQPRF